ncbi:MULTISPECIES: XisH family protein [unclassified Okeania]|uniref:XisH family protein n=1 Tax=unclassified Okeania TaxID=2634635 RepID=UPI0013BD6330|nr:MULTISPECIES: XisH family protein [unclassified Okeania]NET13040.1 fatty-acid oxidation protein subunit alpha [Okeania sp. SIO1H6]NES77246.1 fatty-acid oxidation protein subunit alpha [Okeania sp. SIO1H4]NET19220.1 fatty-acid oxidation protein subunit alpha [Okeania sp. SIO1H5]NET74920.1 fatty-acid oxidation protein subunit alpha [Okeania sp. SIO1F9]NET93508.1 fatty-acid oxidation protein subunit alpha [Okeania sp. SIO1H2]
MAKDIFHQQVKNALIKDGWNITHDPFTIRISEAIKLQIDLAAENAIAAERGSEKIAVEIKSFIADSDISSFHTALGQYLNYCQALEEQEADRIVYLAIPVETYQDFFQLPFIQRSLKRYQVKLIIFNPKLEVISEWIN